MKRLILVRHAKTEQLDYRSTKSDFERCLKPRGHSDSILVADELIKKGLKPDLILSSSAQRAMQTAQIIAKHMGYDAEPELHRFLYDGYTTAEILGFLERYEKYDTIMIVAHNPEIAMLAINLASGDYYHFPTSATASITFDVDSWSKVNAREGQPEWFVYPSMIHRSIDD